MSKLHCVTTHNIILFIVPAVRTSNPAVLICTIFVGYFMPLVYTAMIGRMVDELKRIWNETVVT
jgi:hypothetical protein